jgi:hypothetical protein
MTGSTRRWLTVDPGETTGWSVWRGTERVTGGQDPLWDFIDAVDEWLECPRQINELTKSAHEELGAMVVEDWRLYPWVIGSGALDFDACRTARGIGALELLARRNHIPIILQPASIKDAAKAAGAEEMYVSPVHENRHQNDSIQHGVFYLALNGNKPPC